VIASQGQDDSGGLRPAELRGAPKRRGVAYLVTPEFGAEVLQRCEPTLCAGPWALLDDHGRVLTLDALAAASGIAPGQTESQAMARCPAAMLRPANRYPVFELQSEFLARVALYTGRWQPAGLGCAYLEIDEPGMVANDLSGRDRLTDWCQALAVDIRKLGLTPSLGLTHSKFGAFVAGQAAGRDIMLLMGATVARSFVATQPVALLPLDAATLLQLRHLGIRSLGDYARLPAAGVLARFGEAGRTAQRWAQGHDERPVIPPGELPQVSSRIEFEAPLTDRDILLRALLQRTAALLVPLHANLQAVGRLSLTILTAGRRIVPVAHTFQLPAPAFSAGVRAVGADTQGGRRTLSAGLAGSPVRPDFAAPPPAIQLALAATLDRAIHQVAASDGEGVSEVTLTLGDISDAPAQQLSLFDEEPASRAALTALLDRLAARFGPHAFQMAALTDPGHPLPERRASWKEFS